MVSTITTECVQCPICGQKNTTALPRERSSWIKGYSCPDCGNYYLSDDFDIESCDYIDKLKTYLFYHNKTHLRPYICPEEEYEGNGETKTTGNYSLPPSTVYAWYPKSFAEKIDLILLKLDELAEYDGAYISTEGIPDKLFFCSGAKSAVMATTYDTGSDRKVQIRYVLNFLTKNEYVVDHGNWVFQLTPKALERIYELRKTQSTNKNVFVSMAFNDETKPTREAIKAAIIKSGYSPEFLDEIIHNKQIVPEMFRLIRESRFLILEISDPNYGAYYEAGYAMGLGKEVIICCSREVFDKDFGDESKYRKPHFDILQKQLLLWTDYNDLIKQLTEWIKAIVG